MAEYYWTAFDWADYDRKTTGLTFTQHGAYVQLMREYYLTGGPLPADVKQLLRSCRAVACEEVKAIEYILAKYFELREDGYHHSRCDEEIAKARVISEKRAKSGAIGGKKRQANAKANASGLLKQNSRQLQSQLHKKPPPPFSDQQLESIVLAHPACTHLQIHELPSNALSEAMDCVEADGYDDVLAGTRAFAATPEDERKFDGRLNKNAYEFFKARHYRKFKSAPRSKYSDMTGSEKVRRQMAGELVI